MISFRDRLVLGILSVVLPIAPIYFLLKLPPGLLLEPYCIGIATAIIAGFNAAILLAWLAGGIPLGMSVSALSLISASIFYLSTGFAGHPLSALSFFLTSFMGYFCLRDNNKIGGMAVLKLEKLDEEINLLSNDIENEKARIDSLGEKSKRYSTLKDVAESLSSVLAIEDIKGFIIDNAIKTVGKSGRALLFLVDTERQELMLSAFGGDPRVKEKMGDLFDNWVLRHRKSLMVEDITRDFRFPTDGIEKSKQVFRSLIATPLITEDKIIGILRMDSIQESYYLQGDLRLLDIIADLGAVAIQNSMLYSRTQELALRDSLTGLFVRRHFVERFEEELNRQGRKKGTFSLLMLDIDHFKEYNDRYGHAAGDLVLKYLARLLNSMVREGDIVARYGGEEIAILLCGRDKGHAVDEAEDIKKVLKAKPLMIRRRKTNVTVSIGLSSYPEDAVLEEELTRIADERLYKAKVSGRDKVCSL